MRQGEGCFVLVLVVVLVLESSAEVDEQWTQWTTRTSRLSPLHPLSISPVIFLFSRLRFFDCPLQFLGSVRFWHRVGYKTFLIEESLFFSFDGGSILRSCARGVYGFGRQRLFRA